MNSEYRRKLERYLADMALAKRMRTSGIITHDDYLKIEKYMRDKHSIPEKSLYRGIDLIMFDFRANMSHYKPERSIHEAGLYDEKTGLYDEKLPEVS